MKAPKATDRRVLRTQRTLREALIELILERGWDEISVQHICERADVGRSTFYTHFADKEDLLVSGFDELHKWLRGQHGVSAGAGSPPLAFSRALIDHTHDHRRLFRAMVGKHSGHLVQRRFRQLLVDLIREELVGIEPRRPRLDAAVHYIAGALFELLVWWLDAKTSLGPADVDELFHGLTGPALVVLRGPR